MLLKTQIMGGFVLLAAFGAPGQPNADQQAAATPSLSTGPPRLRIEHKSVVTNVAWSPDGKKVATGTREGTIRIIDVASGKEIQNFAAGAAAGEFAFSPDGKRIAVLEGRVDVGVWDVHDGKLERNNQGVGPSGKADHLAFTADGQRIMGVGIGRFYQWWDVVNMALGNGGAPEPAVAFAAIAFDGSVCGWCDAKGQCRFYKYNPNSLKISSIDVMTLQVGSAGCIAFGPDGRLLAVGGDQKEVQLWDLGAQKPTAKLTGLEKAATTLGFSGDGKTLVALSGDGNSVRVWDLTRTSTRCQINHNPGEVGALALSPDGKMLATTAKDGKVLYVWTNSARLLSRAEPPLELAVKEVASLWAELANPDYEKADAAWRKLGSAGDNAIPFLRNEMRAVAVPAADTKRIETLVGELNAEKFAIRERASKELLALGELAIMPLQRVLEKPPSPEARDRAILILKKIGDPQMTPDRQRVLDAIDLLEQLGTDKARALLEEIERDALVTQIHLQARRALERMRR